MKHGTCDNRQDSDQAVISINSLSKSFDRKVVLRGIDLSVAGGQSVCLCGANGAGKSTLLRLIAGLLAPDSGSVAINGHDMHGDPEKAKLELGMVSHSSMVYPDLTVVENLKFAADIYGVDAAGRIDELLRGTALASYRFNRASILSRGLLQWLAVARALVHRPKVLLADEPFTGLDGKASGRLLEIFDKFTSDGGTIVMVTHDIRVGLQCCDRAVVLDKAQLVFDAATSEIDTERFTRDYLSYAGSPGCGTSG